MMKLPMNDFLQMLQANFSTSDFRDGLDIAGMMNVSWAKASCHCRSKGG